MIPELLQVFTLQYAISTSSPVQGRGSGSTPITWPISSSQRIARREEDQTLTLDPEYLTSTRPDPQLDRDNPPYKLEFNLRPLNSPDYCRPRNRRGYGRRSASTI